MRSVALERRAGTVAMIGGVLGVVLAPVLVMVKYLTGWSVVPEPWWVGPATQALGPLLSFAAPHELWMVYGAFYTAALLFMFGGIAALARQSHVRTGRVQPASLWIVLAGLIMVIAGDAVHTATWHQNGLRVPTPGTNPLANTAYAVHMMGMNFVMLGSLATGIISLRSEWYPRWLAFSFLLVFPAAVLVSLTILPTTPSGGLWIFSMMMVGLGLWLRSGIGSQRGSPAAS